MKLTQLTTEQKLTYVGLLTEVQKNEIVGQLYAPDSFFNPLQDNLDRWIISVEEMEQCVNPDYLWVKDLELIPYEPKPTPPPFEN
jgi:hypothetical protein